MVCGALHIRLPAQGVHPAACHTHVSKKELDNRHAPDILDAHGMHGIHDSACLAGFTGFGIDLVDLLKVCFRSFLPVKKFADFFAAFCQDLRLFEYKWMSSLTLGTLVHFSVLYMIRLLEIVDEGGK